MGTLRFGLGVRRRRLRFVDWHWSSKELLRKARANRTGYSHFRNVRTQKPRYANILETSCITVTALPTSARSLWGSQETRIGRAQPSRSAVGECGASTQKTSN